MLSSFSGCQIYLSFMRKQHRYCPLIWVELKFFIFISLIWKVESTDTVSDGSINKLVEPKLGALTGCQWLLLLAFHDLNLSAAAYVQRFLASIVLELQDSVIYILLYVCWILNIFFVSLLFYNRTRFLNCFFAYCASQKALCRLAL